MTDDVDPTPGDGDDELAGAANGDDGGTRGRDIADADGDAFDEGAWVDRLREMRAEKDEFFASHPQSPIPPDDREAFDGLDYFDPDAAYRVDATVSVHDDPESVDLDTSDGRTVRYRRVATFEFDLDGESFELAGYRRPDEETRTVFVPFRDKTTGQQTYEGGRYMELEPERDLEDGDGVVLDFNLAYTPFCAFSETFACPLPPGENWLETTIPAGERERERDRDR